MALGEEASSKLPSIVFGEACPTRDVFAAVQDANVPAEDVGKGPRFRCGDPLALWGEKACSETVQSKLFRCEPQLTRLCSQCLLDVRSECDDHKCILSAPRHGSVYHLSVEEAFSSERITPEHRTLGVRRDWERERSGRWQPRLHAMVRLSFQASPTESVPLTYIEAQPSVTVT
jgi:hypothetical protein